MSTMPKDAPSAELRARVLAEVAKAPSLTRPQHRRRVALVAAVGALATTSLFFAMGGFHAGARPVELIVFTVGFGVVAAFVLTRLSASRSDSMLPRPRHVLLTVCVAVAPLLALVPLAASLIWPDAARENLRMGTHVGCAVITLAQGALPLVALLVPKRGSDPVHPAITGAALGMTAGAWTAMMAYLRCPHAEAVHCILAHVVPTLVLTAIGAVLGRALLKLR